MDKKINYYYPTSLYPTTLPPYPATLLTPYRPKPLTSKRTYN